MGVAIGVTRLDHSSAELRSLARSEAGAVACRILAIAHVLDGASRADAATSCGMDRQTLRDWVHRFNAGAVVDVVESGGGVVSGLFNEPFPAFERRRRPRHERA